MNEPKKLTSCPHSNDNLPQQTVKMSLNIIAVKDNLPLPCFDSQTVFRIGFFTSCQQNEAEEHFQTQGRKKGFFDMHVVILGHEAW